MAVGNGIAKIDLLLRVVVPEQLWRYYIICYYFVSGKLMWWTF